MENADAFEQIRQIARDGADQIKAVYAANGTETSEIFEFFITSKPDLTRFKNTLDTLMMAPIELNMNYKRDVYRLINEFKASGMECSLTDQLTETDLWDEFSVLIFPRISRKQ